MTTYRPMPSFETGPVEVGNNLFAYLQWNGGWGISNAGFLVNDDSTSFFDNVERVSGLTKSLALGVITTLTEHFSL